MVLIDDKAQTRAYRLCSRSIPIGSWAYRPRGRNQSLRKIGEDPPIMRFVGIGPRRARHAGAETHVVQLAAHRTQARLDVAQILTIGQLREGQRQILIPAGEVFRVAISAVAGHAFLKLFVRQMLDQLRRHRAARVHPALLPLRTLPPSTLFVPGDFKSFLASMPLIPLAIDRLHQRHPTFPGQ